MSLESLLNQATPGPWSGGTKWRTITGERRQDIRGNDGNEVGHSWFSEVDAALIALAPDMARLLVDMAAFVRGDVPDEKCEVPDCDDPWCCSHDAEALLARFAALDAKAGGTT